MRCSRLTACVLVAPLLGAGCVRAEAQDLATLETPLGSVSIRLLRDQAPRHVENFEKLALSGFYDGTTFHRVIPGFIIQGGSPTSKDADPRNDNFGTPGYALKPEFNAVPHDRGVVAMARNPDDPDTAGSQFFIVLGRAPQLDSKYTVFGRVTDGMEIADKIAAAPRDEDNYDRPFEPVVVRRVRIGPPGSTPPTPSPSAAPPVRVAVAPTPARPTPASVLLGTPAAVAAPAAGRVRTTQDFVNIREGPGADRTVLQKVSKGTVLPTKGRQGDWLAVQLSSGKTGYVRQDMVEPAP